MPGATANEVIAAAAQGVEGVDPLPATLRLYDLRHTCASLLISEGASVKAVQAQLGHSTATVTLDTYGHLFRNEMDSLAERLDRLRAEARADPVRTQGGSRVVRLGNAAGR